MIIDLTRYPETIQSSYRDLLYCEDRKMILCGGAGAGKSYFAAQKMIYRCLHQPGIYLVLRKTFKSNRISTHPLLLKVLENIGLKEFVDVNKTDLTITFKHPFRSIILFGGLDDVEKIKSIVDPVMVWIEEASQISKDDYLQVDLRLRGKPYYRQMIMTTNPVGGTHHWLYQEFFKGRKEGVKVYCPNVYNNAHADKEYIKALETLAEQNSDTGAIYLQGKWTDNTGCIYKYSIVDQIKDNGKTIYGLDFGYNDPTVLVQCVLTDGIIYVDELIYQSGLSNNELIKYMDDIGVDKKRPIYADCAEPSRINDISKQGYYIQGAKKGPNSILSGINYIKNYKMYITKQSISVMRDVDAYVWRKKSDGTMTDIPIDGYDHGPDAIRYAIYSHYYNPSAIDPSKPMIYTGIDVRPQYK